MLGYTADRAWQNEMQERWQRYWAEHRTFVPADDGSRPRQYVLDMFPYPSGDLHMGHAEAFGLGDIVARFAKLNGYDVLHPIGWDSFGLPAENAAIQRDEHPARWTYANIETQAKSFRRYGLSFDWDRRLHTSDPQHYRWTQWLFLRFRERGLAYRKDSYVNWCPKDQTVLANEQVLDGICERCGSAVTKRKLNQWYFRITEYAQRLLDDMDQLAGGWPERVLAMQRNWIGRSTGAYVEFALDGEAESLTVSTSRPDTLYGATFVIVAPDSDLAARICSDERRADFEAYLEQTNRTTEIERQSSERSKTGVFLGRYATNPVNGERIPVWTADYVLADYGTGAVMGVPAHDQRDLDFAKAYQLPVRGVVDTGDRDPSVSSVATMIANLSESGGGRGATTYRLRDWLLSRQRFWGCPIPIIHCSQCGDVPVPDDQLPVELPHLSGKALTPNGISPLAAATDWVSVDCPTCGEPAKRDSDTMDTFVDSSWYFFRYCSPGYADGPFDPADVDRWMPASQYVGGVEHATSHLLYMRFFTKVLYDMGMVTFSEPILRLLNQGQVLNHGKAMSKSLGNGVDLGKQIDEFGVDAVRIAVVFAGPPEDDIDWADISPGSSLKFLQRAWRLAASVKSALGVDPTTGDPSLRRVVHSHVDEITKLIIQQKFNVAVARIMEVVNATRKTIDGSREGGSDPAVREAAEAVTIMLSLVAPYLAEEMWELLGHPPSVAEARWPAVDPALLNQDAVTCVVQIGGKVRGRLTVPPDIAEDELLAVALAEPSVTRALNGRTVTKAIVNAPRLVSLVV